MFEVSRAPSGEIVLKGRLDAAQCERALEFFDAVPDPHVVDFAGLEYISSAGLGVLLKTQKRVMPSGRGLRLINVSRHIGDIFRYAGFDKIFQIERSGGSPPGAA
jgi:anti-sigma B factor antagonist